MNFLRSIQLTRKHFRTLYWAFAAFWVAYALNACGDAFKSEESSTTSTSNIEELSVIGYDQESLIKKIPYALNSTTTSKGPSGKQNISASGGLSVSGGKLDQGATSESRVSTITYEDYDGKGFKYFEKSTEPDDQTVEEGQAFSFQYVAIGRFPLKYNWFKLVNEKRVSIGADSTVFSKLRAQLSDAGTYLATVEDVEGNVLTSRTVQLQVRPLEKPCLAGEYGWKADNQSQLFRKDQLPSSYIHNLTQIPETKGTYLINVSCDTHPQFSPLTQCTGRVTFQCVNGQYKKIDGGCYCTQEST